MKTKLTTLLCLLVMCLFVVASLVACPADGTDGKSAYQLWLDQGNTGSVQDFVNSLKGPSGAAGANGVGIASVERNDAGELVLTYTDGNTVNLGKVVFEDPSVKCDHEFKEYAIQEATCSEGGHVLNVCSKDCGYAYITYTDVDPDNHSGLDVESVDSTCTVAGYDKAICTDCDWADEAVARPVLGHDYANGLSVIVTAPTCEKDGCITSTCQRCGDVDVEIASTENNLFATGHDDTGIWVTVVDEGANICLDGGQKLLVCKTCFTGCTNCAGKVYDVEKINPENHAVTADWTVTVTPTFETKGELSGFCAVCGTNGTVELPVLGSAYTKTSPVIPTCTTSGTDNYAYTYKGWSGSFDVTTTTVHVYNGVEMPLDKVYAPHEVETVFGNAPATCLDASGKGSFTCDLCSKEYLVSVKGECEYTEDDVIEFVDSSCSQTGHKTYKCPTCGEEHTVTIGLKDHVYTGAPTITGPSDATENKIILAFDCDNCTNVKTITCDSYTTTYTPATCAAPGKTVYTYTYTDNGTPVTGEFEVPEKQLAHYYNNGEKVEIDLTKTYALAELKEIFGDALTDLTTFGNVFTDCTTAGKVAFTCSGCGVEFLFDATGDHTWTESGRTPANCTDAGTISYVCGKDATHTKTETNAAAPALGHNYALDAAASDLATGKLKFVCANDAAHKLDIDATWFEIVDTPATCLAGGSKVVNYKYEDPNTGLETAVKTATLQTYTKTDLHTHGTTTTIDLNKQYTISELKAIFGDALTDLNFFGNFPTTCQADVPASFVCDVCAQDLLILHVRGDHDWTDWTDVPAECGVDGYKYRTCQTAGCDEREQEKTADALEHIFNYALTEPTADVAGKLVVTCDRGCDYNKEYAIPAKGDAAYTSNVDREATCQAVGQITYTYKVMAEDGETVLYTYNYSEEIPVVEHENAVPPVEITWELNGYLYTGYYCGECQQMIVTNVEEITD